MRSDDFLKYAKAKQIMGFGSQTQHDLFSWYFEIKMNHSRNRDKRHTNEHDKSESKMSSTRSIYTRSSPNTNTNKQY